MALSENERMYLYELESDIEDGNVYKMVEWASFYYYNHPEMIDDELSEQMVKYYEEGVDEGISLAALNLGAMYYSGVFIEQDFKKAVELYMIAAESDDEHIAVRALCNLGYCHYYGRDIPVDYEKAFNFFMQGSVLYNDANCLYKLGDMYRHGNFVNKDNKTALKLYKQAYYNFNGENDCLADVCTRLGEFYLFGIETEKNLVEAIKMLSQAEALTYEKMYNKDPFAAGLLPKITELLEKAKKEFSAELSQNP